jgi:hypothetical protein
MFMRLYIESICVSIFLAVNGFGGFATAQTPRQPRVAPGPNEPDWAIVLKEQYGLSMFADLLNPVIDRPVDVPGLFRKAGPGPVMYTPVIALGLETTTRGGWYTPGAAPTSPRKHDLWSYTLKNTADDLKTGKNLPPKLAAGSSTTFDPGAAPFGLWVSNEGLKDGGAVTEPAVVAAVNARLSHQPYKAMIYPVRDRATGRLVPHRYLIGWEYSTNDDFQDVVCRLDNVDLIETKLGAGRPK